MKHLKKSGARPDPEPLRFEAIGTRWEITARPAAALTATVTASILKRIEAFDAAYSRFRTDSLVWAMSRRAGTYLMPDDAPALLSFYRALYDLTDGLVTPLIGRLLSDAGYDAAYSLRPQQMLQRPPVWDDVLTIRGRQIRVSQPVLLDFGAAGKGYLVDLIGRLLQRRGIGDYCIDAGGDILVRSLPQRIGLEHPDDQAKIIGVATIDSGSLCASASNRRAWGGLHHIMHPLECAPVHSIKAVWTWASETMVADGMATCLFFADPRVLQEMFAFEYLLVRDDDSFEKSDGFPGTVYTLIQ